MGRKIRSIAPESTVDYALTSGHQAFPELGPVSVLGSAAMCTTRLALAGKEPVFLMWLPSPVSRTSRLENNSMRWPAIILGFTSIAVAVVLAKFEMPLESGCIILFGFFALMVGSSSGGDHAIGEAGSHSTWSLDSWGNWDSTDVDWFDD